MKAAVSETNMMVVAIILIGIIAGVATTIVTNLMKTSEEKSNALMGEASGEGSGSTSGDSFSSDYNYTISDEISNITVSGGAASGSGSASSSGGISASISKNLNNNTISGSLSSIDKTTLNQLKGNTNKVISGFNNGGKNVSFSEKNKELAKESYNKTSKSLKDADLNSATSKSTRVFEENGMAVTVTTYSNVKNNGTVTVTSYYQKENGEYKLVYVSDSNSSKTNKNFSEMVNSEKKGKESFKTIDPKLAEAFGGKVMDIKLMKDIYDKQKDIAVILNSYSGDKIQNTGSGFFLNKGIVVTTFSFLKNALINSDRIIAKTNDKKAIEVTGVVSINEKLDIAVLKLKTVYGKEAVLKNSNNMKKGTMVLAIGTKSGYNLSAQSGVVIESGKTIKNLLPLSKTDEGSPLFDAGGYVVGVNTAHSINNDFSEAIPAVNLLSLQRRLQSIPFTSVKETLLSELKTKYYYNDISEENKYNKVDSSVWNEYKKIGDIENAIKLKLIKSSYKDGIVSLRYLNEASKYFDTMDSVSTFKQNLVNMNYKKVLETENKSVFEGKGYKTVIIKEMNYLIVLLIKE